MGAWTFVQPRFENLIGKKVGCTTPTPPLPAHTHTDTLKDMF